MEYASKATADAGLTTGIIGTALGALNSGIFNGGLGNLFGGNASAADLSGMAAGAALAAALGAGGRCSEDKTVNRYELSLQQNMMYSDYYNTAMKFGVCTPEFFGALAKEFLFDKDGPDPKEKLAAYYRGIVER